jgi:hypothetical protein
MDQVRAILKVIWQQRFWVLVVLGPLVAAVCWMMASGKLQAAFTANKGTIDGHFNTMSSITSEPVHGNDDVNAKERAEAVKISKSVRDLWQRLYDSQREQVLKWPAVLGEDFIEEIDKKKFLQDLGSPARRRYLDYIKNRFDALVEIVDAKKMEGVPGEAGLEGLGIEGGLSPEMSIGQTGPGVVKDYLVDWLDQGELRQQLEFGSRIPSAKKVWVTQEDLWVYETLLNVIKNTNNARGATRAAENAAIRVIVNLDVGKEAADAMSEKGNIVMPSAAAGEGGFTADMGAEHAPDSFLMEDQMGDASSADAQLLAGRYVDSAGAPIPDGADTGVEHRKLPIRMSLVMDQRWIPRVLVECANAPLPIEVQRLRINPELSGAGFEDALSSSGGGMEAGGVRSFNPQPTFGQGMFGQSTLPTDLSKDFVNVEVQGLVYIYQPPSDAALTIPGAEEATPTEEGAPSAEVAAVP